MSVEGKRAYCGPTGSLSYEIQATPILKIELPVLKEGPSNVVPKDLAGVVPKGPSSIKVKADKI